MGSLKREIERKRERKGGERITAKSVIAEHLVLNNKQGQQRALLTCTDNGQATLSFSDQNGAPRLVVGILPGGYEGEIYEQTRFLVHPNEYVSIRPSGAQSGGSPGVNVSVSVSGITVNVSGGVNPEQVGRDVGREILKTVKDHADEIGREIMRSSAWPQIKANIKRG